MKYKITFILGAGFPQPLGLPVMSNFLDVAKDLAYKFPNSYPAVERVIAEIQKLHTIRAYLDLDLTNIENLFSLFEMANFAGAQSLDRNTYEQFIRDVITATTPPVALDVSILQGFATSSHNSLSSTITDVYFKFFLWAMGGELEVQDGNSGLTVNLSQISDLGYAVNFITLNYDLTVESFISGLCSQGHLQMNVVKEYSHNLAFDRIGEIKIAKLHGSLDSKIVPPTWSKNSDPSISSAWRLAYSLLNSSHEINILGYSLPETDVYIKFLLGSALQENRNLKRISVTALDPDGSTQDRFASLLRGPMRDRFRFHTQNVIASLQQTTNLSIDRFPPMRARLVSRNPENLPMRRTFA